MNDSIGLSSLKNNFIGEAQVDYNIFDFPSFTLVEYSKSKEPNRPLGSTITLDGNVFTVDNITVSYLPNYIIQDIESNSNIKVEYAIVYKGTHITKRIVDFPINVRQLVQSRSFKKTGQNYIISLEDIYKFAVFRSGYSGRINFLQGDSDFTIPTTAEGTEYLSLSNYLNDLRYLKNYYFVFSGNSMTFRQLSNSVNFGYIPVGEYNLTKSDDPPCFNRSLLELNNYPEYKQDYVTLDDNTYALYAGDSNPTEPPLEYTEYPKNQSIMYGGANALTKSFKITVYQADSPIYEIDGTFGFAHALVELAGDELNSETQRVSDHPLVKAIKDNPEVYSNLGDQIVNLIKFNDAIELQNLTTQGYEALQFAWKNKPVWKLVKCVVKDYIYIPVKFDLDNLFSVVNDDGSLTKVELPEDFKKKFNSSNYSVLSRIVSTGYELRRFNDETLSGTGISSSVQAYNTFKNTSDAIANKTQAGQNISQLRDIDAVNWISGRFLLESFLYRKVPIVECIDYGYAPFSLFYKDEQYSDQFTTTLIRESDIKSGGSDSKFLTVIIPDPNWKPTIMQLAEHTYKRSIAVQGNPNWKPTTRNYYASNPTVIYTGSEEENYISYQPLPSFNTTDIVQNNVTIFNTLSVLKGRLLNDIDKPSIQFPRLGLNALATASSDNYTITENFYTSLSSSINQIPTDLPINLNKNINQEFDLYMVRTKTRTANNQGYKDGAQFENYEVVTGRPPELPTKKNTVDLRENRDPLYSKEFYHYLTSDIQTKNVVSNYSNSLTNNLDQLKKCATNYLIQEHLISGNTVRISIDPSTKIDIFYTGAVEVAGNWKVISYTKKTTKFSNNFMFASATDVEFGDLKKIKVNLEIVNKLNRNAKYSNLGKSGKIFIDPNILSNISKNPTDVTLEFSQKGFGRFISLNNPAQVDPVALAKRLSKLVKLDNQ